MTLLHRSYGNVAVVLLAAFVAACAAACTGTTPRQNGRADAGTGERYGGTCVPFVLADGRSVCLMSSPSWGSSAESGLSVAALTDPASIGTLPRSVDLRSQYMNGCVQVRNQGECGWCVPNAVSFALDSMYCEAGCSAPRASPAHLVANNNGGTIPDCGPGMNVDDIMMRATQPTVSEESWPSAGGASQTYSMRPDEMTLMGGPLRATGFQTVERTRAMNTADTAFANDIRRTLASGRPVVVVSEVCQGNTGWWSGRPDVLITAERGCSPGTGTNPNPAIVGYHAYTIVGYDDNTGEFIAMNSWGNQWGDQGSFRLSRNFVEQKIVSASSFTGIDRSNPDAQCPMADAGVGGDAGTMNMVNLEDRCAAAAGDCATCTRLAGCAVCGSSCVPRSAACAAGAITTPNDCPADADDPCDIPRDANCELCTSTGSCTFCNGRCVDYTRTPGVCDGTRVAFEYGQCADATRGCEATGNTCGSCLAVEGCGYCQNRNANFHSATQAACIGGDSVGSNRGSCPEGDWVFGGVAACMPDAGTPDAGTTVRDAGTRDAGSRDGGARDGGARDGGGRDASTMCKTQGAACSANEECCNLDCVGGHCGCFPEGTSCSRSNECCGGLLCSGTCQRT